MSLYPEEFEEITNEEAEKLSHGMILFHYEQIERSQQMLADELFEFRSTYGPDTFNHVTAQLGMSKGEAQSHLNVGFTNFMKFCAYMDEQEAKGEA
jgi:hypothetical protein